MAAVRIAVSRGQFGAGMRLLRSSERSPAALPAVLNCRRLHPCWYDRGRDLQPLRSYSTQVKPMRWLRRRLYALLAVAGISGGALLYVSSRCALIGNTFIPSVEVNKESS